MMDRPTPPVSIEAVMRFGRHRGRRIADLDDGYLYWLVRWADLYDETREVIRHELQQRARRRRSWRPVVRAIYGRRLLRVLGQGPYAVVQPCGDERRELTVELFEALAVARVERRGDCGYEGAQGCDDSRHFVVDLTDWTVLRRIDGPRRDDRVTCQRGATDRFINLHPQRRPGRCSRTE